MSDLDTPAQLQQSLAVRARIADDDVAQIGDLSRLGQIAAEIDAAQMEPGQAD